MTPSTLMGPGWRPRTDTHAEDVAAGRGWRGYRVNNEVQPIQAVMLTWPGEELSFDGDPRDWLMAQRPDLARMRQQAESIAAYYRSVGAEVHWIKPSRPAPPNLVFARDLATMSLEGAIVSRMAAQQRAGEERFVAQALAEAGVPILGVPRETATLEGADVLWVRPDRVLVGIGTRTNDEGYRYVKSVLAGQGATVVAVPLRRSVQHLLGTANMLDTNLCVTYDPSPELLAELDSAGIRRLAFDAESEVTEGRGLNFVAVAPMHIVMPAGCPSVRARLQAEGVRCDELDVSEYIRAEGALGCLTGVLSRQLAPLQSNTTE